MRNIFFCEIIGEITRYWVVYIYFPHMKYFVLEEMLIKASQFRHLTDVICC